ncbi:MAG: bifunctional 23S rRNA (guanine(2069)-N(7))-methyltransferase RlmK/23S rRNA (guanine(2445)-N(2))-methyltransferase RlmL [Actinomycetota bacterium]|nr:bifunctional 23S rRNA (guanine(2069)-N(7))-methyltransferase RlmK/23S rRNA (guanine(2445)-N(2))-methyltransferase RlmL [Actinomycetota bacterium]
MNELTFFATCPRGIEGLLAHELRALGLEGVHELRAGVAFTGSLEAGYRACLWSRLAARVLLNLTSVPAGDPDELHAGVMAMPWEDHLSVDGTLAVDFTSARSPITHTHYGALRVKDAVCDRFRDREDRRPNVDTDAPDVRINVLARSRDAVISIDLSGTALHRRGYRADRVQVDAPLKENLAAAVLLHARWPQIAGRGGGFVDPMCGSGTLGIEAAWIAGDVAPGSMREHWGFSKWLGHDRELWYRLGTEAEERAEIGRANIPPILLSDHDPRAIGVARDCVERAGLSEVVTLTGADLSEARPPEGLPAGLVAVNPPYGERLGEREDVRVLHERLGATLRTSFPNWTAAILTAATDLVPRLGLPVRDTHELYNGRIPTSVFVLNVPTDIGSAQGEATKGEAVPKPTLSMQAEQFANRLRKNVKHIGKWARRTGVTCFRVYDADLPDYNVAIDIYGGAADDEGRTWVHISEYAPPAEIEPATARRRIEEILMVVPDVLGVPEADISLKVRERKRGTEQYERVDELGQTHTVAEDGLLFEINLDDYLDTGLFLDHRTTRHMIRERAKDARFLNLFAYTGSFSVYAAAGGAKWTVTVDMSRTYLEWARRNMRLNGFTGPSHRHDQSDVMAWLAKAADEGQEFDLIFIDPPTFSNSKRMEGTFDVQRDHVGLLRDAVRVLAPGGTIVFSNNRRDFRMDIDALADLQVLDITASTIPKDYERRGVHTTWTVTRA